MTSCGNASPSKSNLISDAIADKLWLELPKFRPTKTFFDTTIGYLARQNSFHPILRYLDALQWDGQLRLDTWLIDHLGAEDIPLNRAVGRITLIAAVRRLRQPGCKFDELPVLEGKQGTGKSTLLKLLAIRPEWFTDSLSLDASQKLLMEQTEGYWIIEVPDLQGCRKTAWEQLKATLSRSEDTARMAYGRHQERRPRRFIAIGTTNDHEYLSDPTGNRQIWPVRLDDRPINPTRFLAERDQLWAEASHYERAGESIRLDPSLWGAAADQQALRTNDDPWADKLREVIGDVEGRICTETLWAIVGLGDDAVSRRTAGDKRRIGSVMVALGWKPGSDKGRITVGGKRVLGWVRTERPAHVKVTLWEFCASSKKLYVMKER